MWAILWSGFIGLVLGAFIMFIISERANDNAYTEGYELGFEHGKNEAIDTILKKVEEHYTGNEKENDDEKDC